MKQLLISLIKDKLYWLALGAASIFWLLLFYQTSYIPNLAWPLASPLRFLTLVLLYPVLEEVVFRGFIQGWLSDRLAINPNWFGVSLANLITSMLFVAIHFWQHPPLWALAVFVPSLLFGFFKDRYHHLMPAILLHCFYNLGYFWLFTQG